MSTNKEFVCRSLNTHLFFLRIMKEHSIFIEMGFMPIDCELAKVACNFNCAFTDLLTEAICLSDGHIGKKVISSGEIITKFTLEAEKATSCVTGIVIPCEPTIFTKKLDLQLHEPCEETVYAVKCLNEAVCCLLKDFICFKEDILCEVKKGHMFTFNYPLLIDHLTREAKHYLEDIKEIEHEDDVREHEMFWGTIMSDHAKFIRGLLDPTEDVLIHKAHDTAESFDKLLKKYKEHPNKVYTEEMIKNTEMIRAFKKAGTEGILKGKIESVIIPLLADHVFRESNHFLRLLNEY